MPLQNTDQTYGTVSRVLHWLTALVILTAIPLGLVANNLPTATDAGLKAASVVFSFHKTLGVLALLIGTVRILWTVFQSKPQPLHPDRWLETALASTVHWLLYLSLIFVPLTGWAHHAATTGFAPILWPFGQTLPFVPRSEAAADMFGALHWLLTKVLAAAVILHVAGALKHMLADRDETLGRMAYGRVPAGIATEPKPHRVTPAVIALAIYAAALGTGALMGQKAPPADQVALAPPASEWRVKNGTLSITIRQLGQDVTGSFADWTAAITFDETADVTKMGTISAVISIPSLQLGAVSEQAMTADFFDAPNHPTAGFEAVITTTETGYEASGTLTLKDRTVPVSMPFILELNGDQAKASGTTTLDRRAFGIGAGYADQTSLGFPVTVNVELEATRGP